MRGVGRTDTSSASKGPVIYSHQHKHVSSEGEGVRAFLARGLKLILESNYSNGIWPPHHQTGRFCISPRNLLVYLRHIPGRRQRNLSNWPRIAKSIPSRVKAARELFRTSSRWPVAAPQLWQSDAEINNLACELTLSVTSEEKPSHSLRQWSMLPISRAACRGMTAGAGKRSKQYRGKKLSVLTDVSYIRTGFNDEGAGGHSLTVFDFYYY